MTPEQLDEIEKLAEEATPDPWCVAIRGSEVTIETAGVECFVVAEMPRSGATDVQDATFIRAMREHALPLVKALREAREERDRRRTHNEKLIERLKETDVRAGEWLVILEKMESERDDARAEVERLRSVLRQVHALAEKSRADWPRHTAWGALVDIHNITKGMVE